MARRSFGTLVKLPIFLALVLTAFGSCRNDTAEQDDRTRGPEERGFSLTVPAADRAASKYCPTEQPPLPEDPTPDYRFEKTLLNEKLGGEGLLGWMHGAVPSYQQYIFTYRKESGDFMDFFKAEQFSLVPATPELAKAFAELKRHDKIRLKGSVFENGSPLTHIKVTSFEVVKPYAAPLTNPYTFDVAVLQGQETFEVFGQVHAIAKSDQLGYAIIVEHKDFMMPIAVDPKHADVAAKLYKGDIVNVAVKLVKHEHGPAHFVTDANVVAGIDIVDPLVNCHDLEKTVEGYLVKFDKSPAISTDVYAVRFVDANGIGRNFTFFPGVGMEDPAFGQIFVDVSAKAKAAWDSVEEEGKVVRNYRSKERIKVKAKGRINVVSLEQANAQVYLWSADDVTFTAE